MPDEREIVYLVRIKGEPAILKCRLHKLAVPNCEHWVEVEGPDGKVCIYEKRLYKTANSYGEALELFSEACKAECARLRSELCRMEYLPANVEDRTVPRPELPPLDESPI